MLQGGAQAKRDQDRQPHRYNRNKVTRKILAPHLPTGCEHITDLKSFIPSWETSLSEFDKLIER